MLVYAVLASGLSFDQIIAIVGHIVNMIQALVLPLTIYLLIVQTRAMRTQTTALVEQSKEMTAQTRVFIDTIYSSTFQSLYDAEAHIGELMMTYPEASRILMNPVSLPAEVGKSPADFAEALKDIDPALRERVRWLGTAMLDFFEHIWTQAQNKGLPPDMWEAWEDYMGKILSETRLGSLWWAERGYYAPGFRRFVDRKVGLNPETRVMPPLPRPQSGTHLPVDHQPSQVARVMRAVTEEKREGKTL